MPTRRQSKPRRKPRATTDQVLGSGPQRHNVRRKWRHHYAQLLSLRDRLQRRQAQQSHDAVEERPNFSTHMADAGTDAYDRDLALGMISSEQDALYQVEEALERIRNGTYGICELTGRPIEPARLEAVPWTKYTAAAEKQLEQDGSLKRTHLGKRDAVPRAETEEEASEEEE
jgi:DnaK suppressor protein